MTNDLSRRTAPIKGGKRRGAGKQNHRKPRSGWPEVYKWLATGTLVVYTAVGSARRTTGDRWCRSAERVEGHLARG
jgi:hypothetical protein